MWFHSIKINSFTRNSMKILDRNGISGLIEKMLYIILIGGVLIMISLPFTLKYFLMFNFKTTAIDTTTFWYYFVLVFLEISGVFATIIVYTTLLLLKNINNDIPFGGKNYEYIRRISIFCLVEAFLYIIKMIISNSVFTTVIFMIFIILWLLLLVVAELFKKAKDYKDENDLTI